MAGKWSPERAWAAGELVREPPGRRAGERLVGVEMTVLSNRAVVQRLDVPTRPGSPYTRSVEATVHFVRMSSGGVAYSTKSSGAFCAGLRAGDVVRVSATVAGGANGLGVPLKLVRAAPARMPP